MTVTTMSDTVRLFVKHDLYARHRLAPTRTAPRIIQPLLFPQLQSPLPDEVNCKVLSSGKKIAALRILDPIHHHLHVVYLILLLLSGSWAASLCSQVPLEFVHAITSPSATRIGTEQPTREVKRLEVAIQYLLTWTGLPACGTNQSLHLQVEWVRDRAFSIV